MRPLAALLLPCLVGCATARTPTTARGTGPATPDRPATWTGDVLREAELARIRCLVVTPLENASDAPFAAGAATKALLAQVDPSRTKVLPIDELRAVFADTPLELPEGVSGGLALELAELLGADAALYGAVEGRSHAATPEVTVTLRLVLAGRRDLLFAGTAQVSPTPGEPFEAAVRRTVLERARPALDRLGSPGRWTCFPDELREALRTAAVAMRPGPTAPVAAPTPAPPTLAPASPAQAESTAPRASLRTQRQRDWAARLTGGGRLVLEDVTFAARTAELGRDGGLADLAVVLASSPGLKVRVEGFVDATSDPAGDTRLSTTMAQAASQRLLDLGVDGSRVVMTGRGGESPILPNFTVRGRAANRRLEVVAAH